MYMLHFELIHPEQLDAFWYIESDVWMEPRNMH